MADSTDTGECFTGVVSSNVLVYWRPTGTLAFLTFSVTALTTGVWYHIAVTRNIGDIVNVYVDGVMSSSGPLGDTGGNLLFDTLGGAPAIPHLR